MLYSGQGHPRGNSLHRSAGLDFSGRNLADGHFTGAILEETNLSKRLNSYCAALACADVRVRMN